MPAGICEKGYENKYYKDKFGTFYLYLNTNQLYHLPLDTLIIIVFTRYMGVEDE